MVLKKDFAFSKAPELLERDFELQVDHLLSARRTHLVIGNPPPAY